MLIDTDLIFDEIQGYEFYHKCEVKAVIDDKVKGEDGELFEFYENIEYLIEEFDEIIVLRKKLTLMELEDFRDYIEKKGDIEIVKTIDRQIEEAKLTGIYITFACLHNDSFYDLHVFRY
ncbi:hypothetical protein Sbal195_3287 [Shewanella baltica OS195]|uniref:Uncharacterized protein n=1 Tax=Shewanella baltica (strain OS195) TaxID=399599 RepID=A9KYH8_SHEB9|nr:hypothetical protein [Shewanella baltica]ABX50449.1 hypothetical protein Sbal195_3287 [Shewanella baltica OS195]ADT95436.1 hypothetical protein Sbal678_3294 [Shewanella baltica OS678]